MSSADEDTSLLDLPGVEEITEDISGDGIPRRNKKAKVQSEIADDNKHVKASGSGSGFVSYLDSSGVDENDDMDDYEIESSLKDSNVSSAIVSKSIKRNTSNFDTEQLTNAKHQEDLKVKDIEAKHDEKMQEIQKQISDFTTENQEHLDSLSNEMTEMKSKIEQLAYLRTNNEKLKEELDQLKSAKASGSGADEDTSLLDLPGVEEITVDISGDSIPRRNKKAKVQSEIADNNKHVKASGSSSSLSIDEIENRLKNIPMKEKQILMNLKPVQLKVKKQFICEICGKNFTSNYNKKTHIKTVHDQIKEFKCEICGKLFGLLANKNTHLKVHENN